MTSLVLLAWTGCKPEPTDKGPTQETAPTGETAETVTDTGTLPGPALVVTDRANYTLSATYTVPELEIRASYDTRIVWSALTTDAWGAPMTASAVPRLLLMEVLVPPGEVGERLAQDDLGFDLLSVWELDATGLVNATVSDLVSGATPFDPVAFLVEDPSRSWVVALAEPQGDRHQLRSAAVLVPRAASPASSASFADGAAVFTWSAAIDGEPLVTSHTWDLFTADFGDLTSDALGKPYDDAAVDELWIARFTEGADVLGPAVWDLPAVAAEHWTMEIAGSTDARLEFARDATGANFPGFTAGDTWLLGARCTRCTTPFPAFVVPVEVR